MLLNGPTRQTGRWRCSFQAALMAGCLTVPPHAAAETGLCANRNLEVSAKRSEVRKEVCAAAELAVVFLAGYGLRVKRPVRIRIAEQPLDNLSYSAYGSYDSRSDLVEVMSPQAIRQTMPVPEIHNQPLDRFHYHSIVAHEVAHALIQQNSQILPQPLGVAAQEYLACVTQLSVLPPEKRDRMIHTAGVDAWVSGDVISGVYMALAPNCFAVKSYLHFQQHPAPVEFINGLLKSKGDNINVE